MYKIDNLLIIRDINKKLYDKLQSLQENINIIEAKNGMETIAVEKDGRTYFYHSKYNPINEAVQFSMKYQSLENVKHILFVGSGLGYHISAILDANPHVKFSVFEPNIAVLEKFLHKFKLKKYANRLVEIFTSSADIHDKPEFFKNYTVNAVDIYLPIINQVYKKELEKFQTEITDAMKNKKESMRVNSQLQQRWMINPIINFPLILKTPNLLIDLNKEHFVNKPVLLVSAGPSLVEDIEYVRKIKDEGRAFVFAMGSAVKSLIAHDIIPDAYFSVDPNYTNQFVVKEVKEKGLKIPLCFGSSTGFETLHNYPGPLINFMLDQDKFTKYILEYDDSIVIYDAVSVANMTLQALIKLKMGPIILAGQNFAYLNNKSYADGIKYNHRSSVVTEKQKEEAKFIESVYGEEIETNEEFLKMKSSMEVWLSRFPNLSVYNTTKNGAKIEHTTFMEIDKVIEEVLTETNVVPTNWIEGEPSFDLGKVKVNLEELEKSFDELLLLGNKCLEYLQEIRNAYTSQYRMLQVYLSAFDKLFDLLQDNIFFVNIIYPMTRVQHREFIERSPEVAQERSPKEKVKLFDEIFGSYLRTIYATIINIQPAFGSMNAEFNEYKLLQS